MRVNDIWASRFKLMQRLNHGATSEVWMAFDTQSTDNNIVALKVLTGNQDILTTELFYRETEALSLITHKNIVAIMDYGFDEECQRYWLALEYIKGKTLDQYLQTAKPDTWTALDIMKDIVEAVVFAHANNVIHRDLKPKNIMLDETGTAIVLDFGIAKMKASLQEQMSVGNMGTRPYAAPEQGTRQADFRLDIHALGGILLYLLTGVAPNTDSILADQVKAASLTAEQKDLLLKMVDQNPEQRLPSILHLKRALVRLLDYERKASTVVYARITQKIINAMESLGIINNNKHWEEALAWLNNELNSTETFIEETDYGSYYIYTSKYSIRFDQDAKDECIYLADIKQLVSADILNNKGWAVSFKSNWRVLPKNGTLPKDACLEDLFNAINDHKIKRNVKKQREAQLKNTVVQWEKILRLQRKLLTENNFSLEYKSWDISDDGATLEIQLFNYQNKPDLLINQPLLISTTDEKQVSFGTCTTVEGNIMKVSLARGVSTVNFKATGEIFLDDRQISIALKRQEDAIRMTRYYEARNPRLFSLIEDPSVAQQSIDTGSINSFFHENLDEVKRSAVEKALRSEMYLVQGPPGTGKTEFISEVIAQILNDKPHARILLTSQSNAAVDNALESLISIIPNISALRIGRIEKIDEGLSNLQLEEVLDKWAEETKAKSNEYAAGNKVQSQQNVKELANISEILQEVKAFILEVEDLEKEASTLRYQVFEAQNKEDPEPVEYQLLNQKLIRIQNKITDIKAEILTGFDLSSDFLNIKLAKPLVSLIDFNAFLQSLEKAMEKHQNDLPKTDAIELIRQEWLRRLGKGKDFEEICAREASVVACTCLGVANIPGIWNLTYDWVIVDEAARATPAEILVPLVRGKQFVLVGDHKQLPPVVEAGLTANDLESLDIEANDLERSLFEEIYKKANEPLKTFLDVQYRMHPGIGKLISDVFYDRSIKNSASTDKQIHCFDQWNGKSVVWLSTSKIEDRFEKLVFTSRQNPLEARIIRDCCNDMNIRTKDHALSVGIISGYAEQKKLLEHLINPRDKSLWNNLTIEIDNVDAFQGKQRDVVIYSTVRSNHQGDIGFLSDFRRLNVALSRARKLLLIVGDHAMLQVAHTKDKENYFAKVIRHITREDPERCMLEEIN